MTGTFLASGVLAIDADLVGAKSRLAPVAGTADTHANGLAHSLDGHVGGRFPLAGFESEAILGEQGAGFFLLNGAPVGNHGRFGLRLFDRSLLLLLLRGGRWFSGRFVSRFRTDSVSQMLKKN